MLTRDRITLRNLVIAISGSTLLAVLVGTSCLGRPRSTTTETIVVIPATETPSVRSSAGGVAGSTELTSADMPAPGTAAAPAAAPRAEAPTPAPAPVSRDDRGAAARSATMQNLGGAPAAAPSAGPTATLGSASGAAGTAPSAAPTAAAPSAAPSAPAPPATGAASPQTPTQFSYRTPTQGVQSGAGGFISEPGPFSATNLAPNPEAGAGPFETDQITPR